MRKADSDHAALAASVPLTVTLGLLAASVLTIASGEDSGRWWVYGELVAQAVLTVAAAVWIGRKAATWEKPPAVSPILLLLGLGTFFMEPIYRILGTGRSGEVVLMDGLKHIVLGMVVVSYWKQYRRLAVLLSLFLMMFSVSISFDRTLQVAAGLFAAIALFWAAADYWEGLRESLIAESKGGVPRWAVGGVAVAFVAVLATASTGNAERLNNLWGFMPSAGGDGWYDPYARDGVRDGDAVVAGSENIKSIAPIEDGPFMVDDRPTLYDVFDDSYDEPVKKMKRQRAIGVKQDFASDACKKRLAALKKAGKEFSTFRKPAEGGSGKVSDRDGGALFYVAGRTPLHLRLRALDLFDGVTWVEEEDKPGRFEIREVDGKPWAIPPLPPRTFAIFDGGEGHVLKIIDLDSAAIPSPPHVRGVHIDKVDRADFFELAHADIPALDRDAIPPLTTIHVSSEVVDPATLDDEWRLSATAGPSYTVWPDHPDWERIVTLADDYASDTDGRHDEVTTIIGRLRSEYRYERGIGTPEEERLAEVTGAGAEGDREAEAGRADDSLPIAKFLFETRVGDDYHFATAAAMLLRARGYATRLVQGFYADPADYDPKARNTPIKTDDVHTWCEVYLGNSVWLTVEATPGYEVLGPPPTILQQLATAAGDAAGFVAARPLGSVATVVLALLAWVFRFDFLDFADTAAWRLFAGGSSRLTAAARLLERRGRRAGLTRPAGTTLRRWLGSTYGFAASESGFLRSLDAASFGGADAADVIDLSGLVGRHSLVALRRRHGLSRLPKLISRRLPGFVPSRLATARP